MWGDTSPRKKRDGRTNNLPYHFRGRRDRDFAMQQDYLGGGMDRWEIGEVEI
jgi:hypothetical protein